MSERTDTAEATELRLTVEDQARYIDVLLARLEYLAGQEVELRDLAATLREQLGRADADIQRLETELTQARAAVARLEGRLAAQAHSSPTQPPQPQPIWGEGAAGWRAEWSRARRHVRRTVGRVVPWLALLYRRLVAYRAARRG